MNVILGGGLVALLARDILGPEWVVIPTGKSRFYTFSPPIAEDYIIRNPEVDEYMNKYSAIPTIHKIGYSCRGAISFEPSIVSGMYLSKLYKSYVPSHAAAYYNGLRSFASYGSCSELYRSLRAKYKSELQDNNAKYGVVKNIKSGDGLGSVVTTDTGIFFAGSIISTVPLHALLAWLGITHKLVHENEYYYHVRTNCLDFEGATQLFVSDREIDFHKVVMVNKMNYIFYSTKRIEYPGQYFMKFMAKFDLIAETSVEKSVCCGDIPQIKELSQNCITCVGSTAVHDDCLDISSCVLRLLRFKNKI